MGSNVDERPPWDSISFGCGGWLQFYLYGVARAIQARGLDHPDVTHVGCSAGALAAAGITLHCDFDAAVQFCKDECLPAAHRHISGLFCLHKYVDAVLDKHVLDNFYDIPEGKLQVAITQLPSLKAERAVKFSTPDELKQALLASCSAFPLAKLIYRNGCWCVDGGLTDFQPVVDDKTITVSPFYFSNCDIKPSRYVPLLWAVLPPNCNDTVDWLYNLGFEDGLAYFDRKGIGSTSRARPHLYEFRKNPHPFDVPGRVTIHRLLGYNLSKLTQGYIAYVLDVLLFIVMLFIVKPLMLMFIYCDLLVQMGWHFASSVAVELFEITPLVLLSTFMFYPNSMMACRLSGIVFLEKLLILGPSQYHRLRECWQCFLHVLSPSLIKGFFTLPASFTMHDVKEDSLSRLSVLYRVFKHAL